MYRNRYYPIVLAVLALVSSAAAAACAPRRPGAAGPTPTTATAPVTPGSTTPGATAPGTVTPVPPSPSRPAWPTRTSPASPTSVPPVPASLLGKDIEVIPGAGPVVALTFDGGANADGLPAILTALASAHVTATFFLTGEFATRYPLSVRAIVAAGHRLGNHTATHPHLPALATDADVVRQLRQAESEIRAAGGTDPRPLFRFPYGDRTAHTIAVVNGAGYVAVRWTVDTLGWKGTREGITATIVVNRVLAAARPGEIVLMHVGSNPYDQSTLDAQALPTVIARLRALGYRFVTLDALLTAA
jgi:peptidoglycan-N-acetylglucosamine deacetylase